MTKSRLPGDFRVYLLFILLFLVLLSLVPRKARFNYEYAKGAPWQYETLTAAFDFPILKTESQMREDREAISSEIKPCFRFNYEVVRKSLVDAESIQLNSTLKNSIAYYLKVIQMLPALTRFWRLPAPMHCLSRTSAATVKARNCSSPMQGRMYPPPRALSLPDR